ncbi:MAG: hypothetical protein ACKVS7_07725 [Gemmatimonadaceae bacterium]
MDTLRALPHPDAVLFCADVQRLARFYASVASMTTVSGDNDHTILESAGFQLIVHAIRGEPDIQTSDNGEVAAREDCYMKVCLPVESLSIARTQREPALP